MASLIPRLSLHVNEKIERKRFYRFSVLQATESWGPGGGLGMRLRDGSVLVK